MVRCGRLSTGTLQEANKIGQYKTSLSLEKFTFLLQILSLKGYDDLYNHRLPQHIITTVNKPWIVTN